MSKGMKVVLYVALAGIVIYGGFWAYNKYVKPAQTTA